jgi:hypothetical protein
MDRTTSEARARRLHPGVPGGVVLWMLLAGCFPDDWDGSPYVPPGSTTLPLSDTSGEVEGPALVGRWRSEGGDLSPLFSGEPFRYVRVEAEFGGGGAYVVTSVDGNGAQYVLTGTYTVDEGTTPATVSLLQEEPYEAEAEGIWEVDGDLLRYEVVQTVPDYGFVPPSPDEGFGSTAGPGLSPGNNVQVYRRAP